MEDKTFSQTTENMAAESQPQEAPNSTVSGQLSQATPNSTVSGQPPQTAPTAPDSEPPQGSWRHWTHNPSRMGRSGRLAQTQVYVGKFFRIFVYEKDWKVLLFAVIISALLSAVIGTSMFQVKENTRMGAFTMVSACIWIGIFNSIQTVCRERQIIKREHRTGLHITAYVAAHMIYQLAICLVQTVLMIVIYRIFLTFPETGLVTGSFNVDLFITFFLILYGADLMGLFVSSLVHTTTTAMTVMPFLLIIQLIFSGAIFPLSGISAKVANLTISKWGMYALCTDANLNSLKSNLITNELNMFRGIEVKGVKVVDEAMKIIPQEWIQEYSSKLTYESIYEYKEENVLKEWGYLAAFIAAFGALSVASLEFIDLDKR